MVELCSEIEFKDIIRGEVENKIREKEFLLDDSVESVKVFHKNDDIINQQYIIKDFIIPWKIIMWRVCCSI